MSHKTRLFCNKKINLVAMETWLSWKGSVIEALIKSQTKYII